MSIAGWNILYTDVSVTTSLRFTIWYDGTWYNTTHFKTANSYGIDSSNGPYYLGCKNCGATNIKYIIYSLDVSYASSTQKYNAWSIARPMSKYY